MNSKFIDFEKYTFQEDVIPQMEILPNKVVVVIRDDDLLSNKPLLEKILQAVKLDMLKDVELIPIAADGFIKIAKHVSGDNVILCFGLKPSALGLNASFKGYRFYQTETFSLLFSHSLAALEEDKKRKKDLWEALQSKFN